MRSPLRHAPLAAALAFAIIAAGAARSALSTLHAANAEHARAALPVRRAATPGRDAAGDAPRDDRTLAARVAAGRQIFFDGRLSEPPGTSCASCHDPAHGYAGNHGSTIGVARGSRPDHFARRNTPSVMYLGFVHRFHFHWEEDTPLPDGAGGFFWDGRADSLAALVEQPLLNPDEMNGGDRALVAGKLRVATYAPVLRAAFGASALDTPNDAMRTLGAAVAAFLGSDELSPFTSRYDDYIRGRATLSAEEQRGLALFRDPGKGNCGFCHKLDPGSPNPRRSPFSDYGFEVVGAPRNLELPAGRAADLGLCQSRPPGAHTDEPRFCGAFRTPSLRNVATRARLLHNGTFRRLRDVVAFYATRTVDTARWYPSGVAFDDLPIEYRGNVNDVIVPYDRGPGDRPRLDDGEVDAIVAFLQTLTDAGMRAPEPEAAPVAARAPAQPRRDKRTVANEPQPDPEAQQER